MTILTLAQKSKSVRLSAVKQVLLFLPLLNLPASGALVWTGAGDGISLFQEANFLDNNGAVPAANTINPNAAVTAATGGLIEITSGNGAPSNFGGSFQVGTGNDLTVSGKTLGGTGGIVGGGAGSALVLGTGATVRGSGFNSWQDISISGAALLTSGSGGISLITTAPSALSLTNGGSIDVQFIVNSWTLSVDGTSTVNFRGGGNPINGGTVDLALGGSATFSNETEAAFTTEHLSKFTVDGAPAVIGSNISVVSNGANGSIVTAIAAVPEPSSALLGAIALLAFARRKRSSFQI